MVNAIDPDIWILFNNNKLHVLLRNLMNNAIKFNKINGSIMLTAGKFWEGYVQLFIVDTRIGTPEIISEKDHRTKISFTMPYCMPNFGDFELIEKLRS